MIKRCLAVLLSVALLAPSVAFAQSKAGVVTTLEGNVSARRVALPSPVPLKFKDDVFLQDTVTTGDKSLARMLLGGKAVVTVRERSILTITEVPGRSTIDLESGKFALAVAREKMRPGEEINIRTPNAIAGVRGTVVVTEVNRQGAQVGGGAPAVVTNFYVLRGTITAQPLDPTTRQPLGTPLQVGTLQAYSGAGTAAPTVKPVPPEQVGQINAGLQPSGPKGGEDAGQAQVKEQALQTTAALLTTLTGGADTQVAFAAAPTATTTTSESTHQTAPIIAVEDSITTGKAQELATESTAQSAAAAISLPKSFSSSFTSTSTSALISLSGQTITESGADVNFIEILNTDVSLAGPLLTLTNSSLVGDGKLLEIENGSLTSTTTSALISLDPSTVDIENALINLNAGTLTLAGALLTDTNGTLKGEGEFLRLKNGSTLKSTGAGALIQLTGTTADFDTALSMTNSTMTLAGPAFSVTNLTDTDTDSGTSEEDPLFSLDASTLTSTGTGALLAFTSTDGDGNSSFLRLVNASTIDLAGPLLSASGGKLGSGTSSSVASFIALLDSSKLTSTGTSALVTLSDVTFDAHGNLFLVRRSNSTSSPSKVTLAGPLAEIKNSTVNTTTRGFQSTFGTANSCCSVITLAQGAELKGTGTSALVSISNSTITISDSDTGAHFFNLIDTVTGFPSSELVAPSTVNLAGPLLTATSSTIKPLFSLVNVRRSSFTSTTTSELVKLTSSTVSAGGTDISGNPAFARMLTVLSAESPFGSAATAASVSLAGPFLSATNSSLSATQAIAVLGGASVTSTTSSPLISLDNTSLKLTTNTVGSITDHGDVVMVGGLGSTNGTTFAKVTLSGPLLKVSNGSALTTSGSLAFVFAGGQIVESHATDPFVSISGGTHKIATDSGNALFRLFGRTTATTTETIDTSPLSSNTSTLTLGTDEPLKRSGSGALLEASNTSITTVGSSGGGGLVMDAALLSATAPILQLKSGASLTTAAEAINLTGKAKLTATGPLLKIEGGALTIASGSAVTVGGGSFLNVTGDLISVNGGSLSISSGALLKASGSSVIKISGGLTAINSGGTVGITNNLCNPSPCTSIGGVQFFFTNSGTSSNVHVAGTPFKGTGSPTLSNGTNTAHVIVDGSASKVIISGN
jgi:hypothetical protein